MRIVDLLKKDSILLNASPKTKSEAIDMLVDLQVKGGCIADREAYKKGILAREDKGSTAVGEGIAIPHAKSEAVKAPSLAAMTVPAGVDYEALDDEPSNLLFMIAAPNDGDVHLEVLSRLMTILMDEDFREKLLNAKDKEEFLKVIDDMENEKYPDEPRAEVVSAEGYKVLAVTACPTGIAHTYMAAEALESKGAAMGVDIKIETNGSGGVKNHLTAEDIERAVGVIVACDKDVPTQRFAGKPVVFTKVANGIKIPEELIQTVLDGKAPIFHGESSSSEAVSLDAAEKESAGRQIYKHLMNGVSHMLPFVIGGGILIALAFLFDMHGPIRHGHASGGLPEKHWRPGLQHDDAYPGRLHRHEHRRTARPHAGHRRRLFGHDRRLGLFRGPLCRVHRRVPHHPAQEGIFQPAPGPGRHEAHPDLSRLGTRPHRGHHDLYHQPADGPVQHVAL